MSRPWLTIARREIGDALRKRWFFAVALLLAGLNLTLARFGARLTGTEVSPAALRLSLIHLQMYLVPLLAFVLGHDAILAERERGSLELLLSYPVRYREIVWGKALGLGVVMAALATVGVGGPLALVGGLDGRTVVLLALLTALLGIVFVALALWLSSWARRRTLAIVLAIAAWLWFVLLSDLVATSALVLTQGALPDAVLVGAIFANPAELFRVTAIRLLTDPETRSLFGLIGPLDLPAVTLAASLAWGILPLGMASLRPERLGAHRTWRR